MERNNHHSSNNNKEGEELMSMAKKMLSCFMAVLLSFAAFEAPALTAPPKPMLLRRPLTDSPT